MRKDTLVGIVGGIVLLAAMVAVFKFEGSAPASTLGRNAYDVTWSATAANGPTTSGTTALGARSEATLDVTRANLTQAKFTLTWTATQGRDGLRLRVTPPQGSGLREAETLGDSGEVSLAFAVPNSLPPPSRLFADGESEAEARLAAQNTKTAGTGAWKVTVAFETASGIQIVPGLPPLQPDGEVDWTVATLLTSYAPALSRP